MERANHQHDSDCEGEGENWQQDIVRDRAVIQRPTDKIQGRLALFWLNHAGIHDDVTFSPLAGLRSVSLSCSGHSAFT